MATLSAQIVSKLQNFAVAQNLLPAAQRNWGPAYTAVLQDLQAQAAAGKPVDPGTIFWFQRAAEVNTNADTPANSFIRSFTKQSASLQGMTLTDRQLQEASGRIGTDVINAIVGSQGSIAPVADLAKQDILQTFNSPSMAGLNPTITWGGGPFAASSLGWSDYGQGLSPREWAIMTTATANACIATATRYPGSAFSGEGLRECTTAVANLGAATQVLQNDSTYRFLKDTFKDAWNWLGQRISADADPSVPAPSTLQPLRFLDGASTDGTKLFLNLDDGASGDRVLQLDAALGRGAYTGPNGTTLHFALPDAKGLSAGASGSISLSLAPGQDGAGVALSLMGDGSVRAEVGGSLFGTTPSGASLSLSGGVLSSVGPTGPNGHTDQSFDLSNAHLWKTDTKAYDAQGWLDIQRTVYDNGTRTDTDHDQADAATWSALSTSYDTRGHADYQTRWDDNGVRVETDWDQANASPTVASWKTVYDRFDRVDWTEQRYDLAAGNGRTVADHDQTNVNAWAIDAKTYDAGGQLDRQLTDYDAAHGGHHVDTDYDQARVNDWSKVTTVYDAAYQLDWQHVNKYGGALVVSDWDQAGAAVWDMTVTAYDHRGAPDFQDVHWDTGALTATEWDQGGTEGWERIVTDFDPAGRHNWEGVYHDGGRRTETDWDLADTADWWSVVNDVANDGRLDWQQVVEDEGWRVERDWDLGGEAWSFIETEIDGEGRADFQSVAWDAVGRRSDTDWDLGYAHEWDWQRIDYAGGAMDFRQVVGEDRRVVNSDWDLGDQHGWREVTELFLADGRRTESIVVSNTYQTHVETWDLLDEYLWDRQVLDFHADGRVYSDVVTYDNGSV